MLLTWKRAGLIVIGLIVGGLLFAWSGLFNLAASSGHWAITDQFLHWAMRSSVRTYALAVEPQPIDDPALLFPAAGHFASSCAPCHGAPGEPRSPVVREMTPQPPDLVPMLDTWRDRELFWIVKHGIKYTGMPAWPSLARDDEIWAMVAFLRSLPEMDATRYRELALGETGATPALTDMSQEFDAALADCARCHGSDGAGRSAEIPIIAGQSEAYLYASLDAYARSVRNSGFMEKAASDAEPALRGELAAYYAAQTPVRSSLPGGVTDGAATDPALVERGRMIAEEGIPDEGVPACLTCHDGAARNPIFPILDGQHVEYLRHQLDLFKAGTRGGTRYSHIMHAVAERLPAEAIPSVAAYFSTRDPAAVD